LNKRVALESVNATKRWTSQYGSGILSLILTTKIRGDNYGFYARQTGLDCWFGK
jgi:hypothetical protein